MTVAWSDLQHKGFVVVPGFLPPEAQRALRADFDEGLDAGSYDLGYKPVGAAGIRATKERLEEVLEQVRAQTDIVVDQILNGFYFDTQHAQKTSLWHQDYDAYYKQCRDHYNYLNFYMPILKPERERSNVCMIPFDTLLSRSPDLHRHLRGGGANFLSSRGRRLVVENADLKTKTYFDADFDVDTLAVTPHLGEADLLLVRGDVMHRSQDLDTVRVAASIRVGDARHGFVPAGGVRWFRDGRKAGGTE